MPILDPTRWATGRTVAEWIATGQDAHHQELTARIARTVELTPDDESFFCTLPSGRLAIVTEECGADSEAMGIAVRVVEAAPNAEVRVFAKDEARDILRQYL